MSEKGRDSSIDQALFIKGLEKSGTQRPGSR
jgi:hypothetical protein